MSHSQEAIAHAINITLPVLSNAEAGDLGGKLGPLPLAVDLNGVSCVAEFWLARQFVDQSPFPAARDSKSSRVTSLSLLLARFFASKRR